MSDVRFRVVVWWWGWFGFGLSALLVALASQGWLDCVVVGPGDLVVTRAELLAGQF